MGLLGWIRKRLSRAPMAPPGVVPKGNEKALLHWIPGGVGGPRCGEKVFTTWTIEMDFITCPVCKREAADAGLRRFLNER